MRKTTSGFTIVELLIVIVVIALLAAITVVAFNGLQSRAQFSAVVSEENQIEKKVQAFKLEKDAYPLSITDCPTPASGNDCYTSSQGNTVRYSSIATNPYNGRPADEVGYDVGIMASQQFIYTANVQHTGGNEFLRFTDLAPYIDKYGIKSYKLEFDIKSADITNRNTANVYFQNGSGARYTFGLNVPVTTSFVRHTVTFTPTLSDPSVAQAFLAFYGTYGTGNVLSVRNVTLQLQ